MSKYFFARAFLLNLLGGFLLLESARAAVPTQDNVRYVGSVNCQSSMCHGGASPSRCQFTVWSREDFHSRAYATLVTSRSTLMAQSLGIASATGSARCTSCHAPYEAIPAAQLAPGVNVTEGVSCEHCHNAAESWLRGHTRPDWTYADRIHAGMRDLRSASVRANTCVACHQVIAPDILKAGHPELIFEMDGQTASEPRHWKEKDTWFGPKAWLVGQATALREISLQLASQDKAGPDLQAQQKALVWLLHQLPWVKSENVPDDQPSAVAAWSNQLAQTVSGQDWKPEMSRQSLMALAATSDSFADARIAPGDQALRAERLVLALDRLSKSLDHGQAAAGQAELSALFAAVQDRSRFNPKDFSSQLRQFAEAVTPKK